MSSSSMSKGDWNDKNGIGLLDRNWFVLCVWVGKRASEQATEHLNG